MNLGRDESARAWCPECRAELDQAGAPCPEGCAGDAEAEAPAPHPPPGPSVNTAVRWRQGPLSGEDDEPEEIRPRCTFRKPPFLLLGYRKLLKFDVHPGEVELRGLQFEIETDAEARVTTKKQRRLRQAGTRDAESAQFNFKVKPVEPGDEEVVVRLSAEDPDGRRLTWEGRKQVHVIDLKDLQADTGPAINVDFHVERSAAVDARSFFQGDFSRSQVSRYLEHQPEEETNVRLRLIDIEQPDAPKPRAPLTEVRCPACDRIADRTAERCSWCEVAFPEFYRRPLAVSKAPAEAPRHFLLAPVGGAPVRRHYVHLADELYLARDYEEGHVLLRCVPTSDRRNTGISGRQAKLRRQGESLSLEPDPRRDSPPAPFSVDGELVDLRGHGLRHGSLLRFGPTSRNPKDSTDWMLSLLVQESRWLHDRVEDGPAPLTCASLQRCGSREDVEVHLLLNRWARLGSDPSSDVVLNAPGVAADHAILVRLEDRLFITPSSLPVEVHVNGRPAEHGTLTPLPVGDAWAEPMPGEPAGGRRWDPPCESPRGTDVVLQLGGLTLVVRGFDQTIRRPY